ncbi:MAG TPA: glycine cleavage system aminomethyltransferase GcvT [Tepidisphaeraceae bacterium]|jgi:aminomethyltransferase
MLKRTPFYDFHVSSGGRMVDFAGWEMPIVYRSITDEHNQTRNSGSIFDVSHMGRLGFSGGDAAKFLNRVFTRDVEKIKVGQCRYGLICNETGGVLDDVIVYRDKKNWLMVVNASNREKILQHFHSVRNAENLDFDLADQTESTAMIALQGPKVIDRIGEHLEAAKTLKRYEFVTDSFMMLIKYTVSRTGYTGEDGVEVILPSKMAGMVIKLLAGKSDQPGATLRPAGLGARDTLRLEAGMPLYGHELSEDRDPLSANLGWAIDLDKNFIGADALRKIQIQGTVQKLVGLRIDGKRIARQGSPVVKDGLPVGQITSGTLSPTLNASIAMAYVDSDTAVEGNSLQIDVRGSMLDAKIVPLPFYKRAK